MPVTATNESMEIDGEENNIVEASTNKSTTNTPSTSNSSKSMATASSGSNVMANPATVPSVTVSLHPLVIMNISEHWTRIRAQDGSPRQGL